MQTVNCTNVCTFAVKLSPGSAAISLKMFDGENGQGALLSKGVTQTTILNGQNNAITLSLGGVVSSVVLALSNATFVANVANAATLTPIALDAGGNQIIGPVPFTTPVTIALQGDAHNEFALSRSTFASPNDAPITVSFSGGSTLESPNLIASVGAAVVSNAPVEIAVVNTLPLPIVAAQSANNFVDSIGMNIHLGFEDSPYATQYPAFRQLLVASGIRHIREGLVDSTWQPFYDHLSDLGARGIKATLITNISQSAALLQQYPARVPNVIEAYEAPNEMDGGDDAHWVADTKKFEQILYTAVKNGPLTSSFPVIGPSLTLDASYRKFGNLSAYMDSGNLHNYFAGFNPGTTGWGAIGFGSSHGSIGYSLGEEAEVAGAKPVVSTETGYCTIPATRNAVTPAVQAIYEPRMFLEQWNAGISRTVQYQFIDTGVGCDGTLGIINANLNPKPAYYSLKNLISILNDPGSNFMPTSLPMAIAGNTSNVHHTLLEKRDGTYKLALWVETPSWDVNNGTGTAIQVPAQAVTLTLASAPAIASLTAFNDDGTVQTTAVSPGSSVIPLNLTDKVTIVSLKF